MKLTAVAIIVVLLAATIVDAKRPNILFLLTDDQDVVLGGSDYMPFLNQHLKQQGTTFKNFFVHTPVCCPSRSSILNGGYLHNIGVVNNSLQGNCYGPKWRKEKENETFAVYAKKAGYQTAYSGKYLNNYGFDATLTVPPGWDKWLGLVGNSQYYNYKLIESNNGGRNATKTWHGTNYTADYLTNIVGDQTLKYIRELTTPKPGSPDPVDPFLIVASWPAAHTPFIPANWAWGRYSYLKAPRTPNYNASDRYMQQKHWLMRQQSPLGPVQEKFIDETYHRRLETLLSVDRQIDQFIQLLEEQGVLDNTIIMYTSDNGYNMGTHRLTHEKYHMYENDIRVPFVMRGPNIPKNYTTSEIGLNIDIAPTIYQLIQNETLKTPVTIPENMDGISLVPINMDIMAQRRTDFLVSFHGEGYAPCWMEGCRIPAKGNFHVLQSRNNTYNCVRSIVLANNTDFVYCRFEDDQKFVEYYDLTKDPWQLRNKARRGLTRRDQAKLEERLAYLRACRGSACRTLTPSITSGNVTTKVASTASDAAVTSDSTATFTGNSTSTANATLAGNATVVGNTTIIFGNVTVSANITVITGNATTTLSGNVTVVGNATTENATATRNLFHHQRRAAEVDGFLVQQPTVGQF